MGQRKMTVEIPCAIGDTVWGIKHTRNGGLIPQQGVVGEIYFKKNMDLMIVIHYVCRGQWNDSIFATEEEAMAEIRRIKREEAEARYGKIDETRF